jgi:hypothetical protein
MTSNLSGTNGTIGSMATSGDGPSASHAAQAASELERLWNRMFGRPSAALEEDLVALHAWFEPWASGRRRRRLLQRLERDKLSIGLPEDWYIPAGDSIIVTPEGRLALERLRNTPLQSALEGPDAAQYEVLLDFYRELAQRGIRKFIADVGGEGEPMYLVAMAAVMVIVASDACTVDRPLVLDYRRGQAVFDALHEPLRVFVAALGQRPDERRLPFDDYPLSRAQARLGPMLNSHRPKGQAMRVWIAEPVVGKVLEIIGRDLRRRGHDRLEAATAVITTFEVIDRGIPVLAASGLALDVPDRRRVRRAQLLARLEVSAGSERAA